MSTQFCDFKTFAEISFYPPKVLPHFQELILFDGKVITPTLLEVFGYPSNIWR